MCVSCAAVAKTRDEGADILILARTDARAGLGLEEALERCREFRKIGADITFLEAPQSIEEMKRYCTEVDGPKLANMLEVRSQKVEVASIAHRLNVMLAPCCILRVFAVSFEENNGI